MEDNKITRAEILERAKACVCTDRNMQYGEPEDNFKVIADLWVAYLTARCVPSGQIVDLGAGEVADMMILFKIGRNATADLGKSADTYVDIAGYAACGAEIECYREEKQ